MNTAASAAPSHAPASVVALTTCWGFSAVAPTPRTAARDNDRHPTTRRDRHDVAEVSTSSSSALLYGLPMTSRDLNGKRRHLHQRHVLVCCSADGRFDDAVTCHVTCVVTCYAVTYRRDCSPSAITKFVLRTVHHYVNYSFDLLTTGLDFSTVHLHFVIKDTCCEIDRNYSQLVAVLKSAVWGQSVSTLCAASTPRNH